MSTEFTRQSSLLPMNRPGGSSLCTFGPDHKADLCHLYINPDKAKIENMILTVHLMPEDGSRPAYTKVLIYYEEMLKVKALDSVKESYAF
jgi:hypothetical protein